MGLGENQDFQEVRPVQQISQNKDLRSLVSRLGGVIMCSVLAVGCFDPDKSSSVTAELIKEAAQFDTPGVTDLLEIFVQSEIEFSLSELTNENRIQVLYAIRDFMSENPGYQIPTAFVSKVMGCTRNNMITIDDGPNENTNVILDILASAEETVIFYLVGEDMLNDEDAVKAIVEAGHLIGYHSMYHEKTAYTPESLEADYKEFQVVLSQILGYEYPLVFVRLPYGREGSYQSHLIVSGQNGTALSENVILAAGDDEPRSWNWDVEDNFLRIHETWELQPGALQVKMAYYLDRYQMGESAVFLLHQEEDDVLTLYEMLGINFWG